MTAGTQPGAPRPHRPHARRPLATWAQVLKPMLAATGLVLLLIALDEVVERLWLTHLTADHLRWLHLGRSICGTILVAILTCWGIIRLAPPLAESEPPESEWLLIPRPDQARRQASLVLWLVRLRWVAVVVAAALVICAVHLTGLLPATVWWPLIGTIGLLAILNATYRLWLGHGTHLDHLLQLQVYLDLVVLTILLHFSGGIENPLSLLMLLNVVVAGVVLRRGQTFGVALAGGCLFALLALGEWSELLPHYTLLIFPHDALGHAELHAAHQTIYVLSCIVVQFALLLLTAFVVSAMARQLHHDTSQLTLAADRALAARQLLEQGLDTTRTGLRVLDGNLRNVWANRQWQQWFGAHQSPATPPGCAPAPADPPGAGTCQLSGQSCTYGGATCAHDCPAAWTLRDGAVHIIELAGPCCGCAGQTPALSPETPVFQLTTAPLRDREGRITQVVELVQDVTRQKQTQARMLQASKMAAVGELAGHVAHEVNNPLAILSAKVHLLLSDRRTEMSQAVAEELAKVVHQSDRVTAIARGLLSYCRPSTGTRGALDVRTPLQAARAMIQQRATTAGVHIREDFAPALPPVQANAGELEQVFLNLLLNALDAMPQGGTLTLITRRDPGGNPEGTSGGGDDSAVNSGGGGGGVAISIQDTGCGMTPQVQARVFEPFYSTKEPGRGTGLGLSICQGLVQSHGGRIELTSSVGQGTCITVHLPPAAPARSTL